jgi:anti-sigma factor RsiW
VVCDDNARLLHGYVDGELDLVRSLEIEEHLKGCSDCAQELRNQQTLRKAFRASSLYDRAPKGLEARVRASVASAASGNVVPISRSRRAVMNWLAVAAAILVALVLTWKMLPNLRGPSESDMLAEEVVASHIRSLQPNHLMDVQSTDQHTVKPWFNGKLDYSPPVKDLTADGFPLVGGRLDYVDHRNVAALVYKRNLHMINVYEWPDEPGDEKTARPKVIQGYNVVFWHSSGMYLCAVSDLNAGELRQFTQLLQQ